jgi:hypothetical protein
MKIAISARERDTILAALRLWQWERELGFEAVLATNRGKMIMDIAENEREGDDASLLLGEIDRLCERINRKEK